MSLYNMICGKNVNAGVILALLGLKECDIERFRDCSMDENGISIYTRTGGGNREDYPNDVLISNPCYSGDEDDDFDSTYATYHFKFPDNIKEDCLKLFDMGKNGIPASVINQVNAVANREETDNDKWTKIYNEQMNTYRQLRQNMDVYETNGHTIVPLSDDAMETLLKVCEKNDYPERMGEFLPFMVMPYKLHFEFEVPKWSFEKDKLSRIKIDLGKKWEIDTQIWERYRKIFNGKYPKAIAHIQNNVGRIKL